MSGKEQGLPAWAVILSKPGEERTEPEINYVFEWVSKVVEKVNMLRMLPPEELRKLCYRFTVHRLRAGQVVFVQGDEADKYYVVISGVVVVHIRDKPRSVPTMTTHRSTEISNTLGYASSKTPSLQPTPSTTSLFASPNHLPNLSPLSQLPPSQPHRRSADASVDEDDQLSSLPPPLTMATTIRRHISSTNRLLSTSPSPSIGASPSSLLPPSPSTHPTDQCGASPHHSSLQSSPLALSISTNAPSPNKHPVSPLYQSLTIDVQCRSTTPTIPEYNHTYNKSNNDVVTNTNDDNSTPSSWSTNPHLSSKDENQDQSVLKLREARKALKIPDADYDEAGPTSRAEVEEEVSSSRRIQGRGKRSRGGHIRAVSLSQMKAFVDRDTSDDGSNTDSEADRGDKEGEGRVRQGRRSREMMLRRVVDQGMAKVGEVQYGGESKVEGSASKGGSESEWPPIPRVTSGISVSDHNKHEQSRTSLFQGMPTSSQLVLQPATTLVPSLSRPSLLHTRSVSRGSGGKQSTTMGNRPSVMTPLLTHGNTTAPNHSHHTPNNDGRSNTTLSSSSSSSSLSSSSSISHTKPSLVDLYGPKRAEIRRGMHFGEIGMHAANTNVNSNNNTNSSQSPTGLSYVPSPLLNSQTGPSPSTSTTRNHHTKTAEESSETTTTESFVPRRTGTCIASTTTWLLVLDRASFAHVQAFMGPTLRRMALFAKTLYPLRLLDPQQQISIQYVLEEAKVSRREYVYTSGSAPSHVYFVASGEATIIKQLLVEVPGGTAGEYKRITIEVKLGRYGPGAHFGDEEVLPDVVATAHRRFRQECDEKGIILTKEDVEALGLRSLDDDDNDEDKRKKDNDSDSDSSDDASAYGLTSSLTRNGLSGSTGFSSNSSTLTKEREGMRAFFGLVSDKADAEYKAQFTSGLASTVNVPTFDGPIVSMSQTQRRGSMGRIIFRPPPPSPKTASLLNLNKARPPSSSSTSPSSVPSLSTASSSTTSMLNYGKLIAVSGGTPTHATTPTLVSKVGDGAPSPLAMSELPKGFFKVTLSTDHGTLIGMREPRPMFAPSSPGMIKVKDFIRGTGKTGPPSPSPTHSTGPIITGGSTTGPPSSSTVMTSNAPMTGPKGFLRMLSLPTDLSSSSPFAPSTPTSHPSHLPSNTLSQTSGYSSGLRPAVTSHRPMSSYATTAGTHSSSTGPSSSPSSSATMSPFLRIPHYPPSPSSRPPPILPSPLSGMSSGFFPRPPPTPQSTMSSSMQEFGSAPYISTAQQDAKSVWLPTFSDLQPPSSLSSSSSTSSSYPGGSMVHPLQSSYTGALPSTFTNSSSLPSTKNVRRRNDPGGWMKLAADLPPRSSSVRAESSTLVLLCLPFVYYNKYLAIRSRQEVSEAAVVRLVIRLHTLLRIRREASTLPPQHLLPPMPIIDLTQTSHSSLSDDTCSSSSAFSSSSPSSSSSSSSSPLSLTSSTTNASHQQSSVLSWHSGSWQPHSLLSYEWDPSVGYDTVKDGAALSLAMDVLRADATSIVSSQSLLRSIGSNMAGTNSGNSNHDGSTREQSTYGRPSTAAQQLQEFIRLRMQLEATNRSANAGKGVGLMYPLAKQGGLESVDRERAVKALSQINDQDNGHPSHMNHPSMTTTTTTTTTTTKRSKRPQTSHPLSSSRRHLGIPSSLSSALRTIPTVPEPISSIPPVPLPTALLTKTFSRLGKPQGSQNNPIIREVASAVLEEAKRVKGKDAVIAAMTYSARKAGLLVPTPHHLTPQGRVLESLNEAEGVNDKNTSDGRRDAHEQGSGRAEEGDVYNNMDVQNYEERDEMALGATLMLVRHTLSNNPIDTLLVGSKVRDLVVAKLTEEEKLHMKVMRRRRRQMKRDDPDAGSTTDEEDVDDDADDADEQGIGECKSVYVGAYKDTHINSESLVKRLTSNPDKHLNQDKRLDQRIPSSDRDNNDPGYLVGMRPKTAGAASSKGSVPRLDLKDTSQLLLREHHPKARPTSGRLFTERLTEIKQQCASSKVTTASTRSSPRPSSNMSQLMTPLHSSSFRNSDLRSVQEDTHDHLTSSPSLPTTYPLPMHQIESTTTQTEVSMSHDKRQQLLRSPRSQWHPHTHVDLQLAILEQDEARDAINHTGQTNIPVQLNIYDDTMDKKKKDEGARDQANRAQLLFSDPIAHLRPLLQQHQSSAHQQTQNDSQVPTPATPLLPSSSQGRPMTASPRQPYTRPLTALRHAKTITPEYLINSNPTSLNPQPQRSFPSVTNFSLPSTSPSSLPPSLADSLSPNSPQDTHNHPSSTILPLSHRSTLHMTNNLSQSSMVTTSHPSTLSHHTSQSLVLPSSSTTPFSSTLPPSSTPTTQSTNSSKIPKLFRPMGTFAGSMISLSTSSEHHTY